MATKTVATSARASYERPLPVASKTLVRAFIELRDMAANGTRGNHIVLEPGETDGLEDVVALPAGAYDLLYARVVAVPLKTTQTRKVLVTISHGHDGALWLDLTKDPDGSEDDNETSFAL